MKAFNLLNSVWDAFSVPQWIFIGILVAGFVVLLCVLLYFLYVILFKPDLKAEIDAMDDVFKEEKKRIKAEKKYADAERKRSAKGIDEETEKARKAEAEAELMRLELMQQGLREEYAREVAGMTLEQLFALKLKESQDMSADFIINAITRRVLIDSEFERRADVDDFKVPLNKTLEFGIADIQSYLSSLSEVAHEGAKGKTADAFKVMGKSFALLYNLGDGKFKLTVKCGPYYGQRLTQLYPEYFGKAKFPYGMIWFSMNSVYGECSLELVKLLGYISYNIAKAGY